ncbi:MAG: superoxide dismutase family protein [Flavobacteriales bacterium]|nr:superoxide dismutase family protein [Flavobacteriales bacterium]
MKYLFAISALFFSYNSFSELMFAEMVDLKSGEDLGVIEIYQSKYGVVFTPHLQAAKIHQAGLNGFHVHEFGSCASKDGILGASAGGHFDPAKTKKHGFPWSDDNHLGDLPPLYSDAHGNMKTPVLAPRLKLSDLNGRSVMIHVGGDNHADHPHVSGGGGERLVCGVIKKK